MTRFKELRRIQAAIEHRNQADLRWALAYCAMRIRLATRRDHAKHWSKIQRRVQAAWDDSFDR